MVKKILFVCTGNVFRSASAEYCLNNYLKDHKISGFKIESAGTVADIQEPEEMVLEKLKENGIDMSKHKQTKLAKKHFKEFNLVVAMSIEHKRFIFEKFGVEVPLFNEVAYGRHSSIKDVWEAVPEHMNRTEKKRKYIRKTIDYIHKSMPEFFNGLGKFL